MDQPRTTDGRPIYTIIDGDRVYQAVDGEDGVYAYEEVVVLRMPTRPFLRVRVDSVEPLETDARALEEWFNRARLSGPVTPCTRYVDPDDLFQL